MSYRNGNYTAFYVEKPSAESNSDANLTKDFLYYNQLRMWKGDKSRSFPFIDSHGKTYDVRDDSSWEKTLKYRLEERLRKSKNIILFLSSITKNSRALSHEMHYGINCQELPIIVIYPDYKKESDIYDYTPSLCISQNIKKLWNKLPKFKDNKSEVPVVHLPLKKDLIEVALQDERFMVQTKCGCNGDYIYKENKFISVS